jgi:arylsulfatase A-like enzyme
VGLVILACLLSCSPSGSAGSSESATHAESPDEGASETSDQPADPPNLIVFLVDTLRADTLGFAGYGRDVSPRLDAWSRRGAVFDQATTPSGWTKPAVISLFTGLYPGSHGVQDKHHVAAPQLITLAEVLKSRGYQTAAFITNFAVAEQFGTGQGFDRFRFFDKELDSPPEVPDALNYVPIGVISGEIERFLTVPRSEPFFAYVHTTDPHYPYLPPDEHRTFGSDSRARYDGEVLFTDTYIGRWLDLLESSGRLENSIVILTADHGEEFREHGGTGHGVTVFQECVRVPMVVWGRGVAPGRHAQQVSLIDIPKTLLAGAGLEAPAGFAHQGRSFWRLATGGSARAEWDTAYSDLVYPTKGITFGYREGDFKLVRIEWDRWGRKDATMLFEVAQDPFEQRDLANQRPNLLRDLRAKMHAERSRQQNRRVEPLGPELDPEARERLKALGYID